MINVKFKKGQQTSKSAKRKFKIARILTKAVRFRMTVDGDDMNFIFQPKNAIEYYRAVTFFTKEEGTIAWLKNNLAANEVLYDIGANIGLYSLYAAKLGRGVKAYAFEPHKFTFVNLMENITANDLTGAVIPIAIPLNDTTDISTMNYAYTDSGSSMSQLGHNLHPENGAFKPQLEELVYCTTLDDLIWKKAIPAPHHIKIDVDGNELKILKGMTKLLHSTDKPRTIQVEINPGQRSEVELFLSAHGYHLDHTHFTADGAIKVKKGMDPETMGYNAVFTSKKAA